MTVNEEDKPAIHPLTGVIMNAHWRGSTSVRFKDDPIQGDSNAYHAGGVLLDANHEALRLLELLDKVAGQLEWISSFCSHIGNDLTQVTALELQTRNFAKLLRIESQSPIRRQLQK